MYLMTKTSTYFLAHSLRENARTEKYGTSILFLSRYVQYEHVLCVYYTISGFLDKRGISYMNVHVAITALLRLL